MASVHDQLRLPTELVIQAKLCPFGGFDLVTHKTRRIWWTDAIDHAVTWGSFFVAPLKQHVRDDCDLEPVDPGLLRGTKAPKRRHFAADLKTRNADQRAIAVAANELAGSSPLAEAGDLHEREDRRQRSRERSCGETGRNPGRRC